MIAKSLLRIVPLVLLFPLSLLTPGLAQSLDTQSSVPSTLNPALPTIFIAGDSTAATVDHPLQQGWGAPFAAFFDPAKVNVDNRAKGGRSSRTFINEGLWDALIADLKSGDIVLIQFAHNDADFVNAPPPDSDRPLRARGTLPGLGEETEAIDNVLTKKHEIVHTFGWYIRRMITDVKAKGATPMLISPTVRNLWTDGKVEQGPAGYQEWNRALAAEAGIDFVDATQLIAQEYQRRGEDWLKKEFFPKDYVHTNAAGAEFNAMQVVAGLKALRSKPVTAILSPSGEAVPDAS
ncbi:lysophospholipase [Nibricoccus aquaticus]|uniref:Lysophospholipase n=1 Tax=Nibricoccus aquaticus TaxID=2576891 RepID=A0A290QKB6_9BACT|nr:rhamnogalacturonan acetylesterase [Nibricoccus aquaticus]ATC65788.1 lysophospholipase [Nibricoccus aquaticus]